MIFEYIKELDYLPAALIFLCIFSVCVFEFINGFHDTANAVATVIYTKSLKPVPAVVWSGIMNFFGVLIGGVGVAMSIVKLLPLNDLLSQPLSVNISMVLAICLAAIVWNLGTWYLGIPCSSSHTLIGSIIGAGVGFAVFMHGEGVNWDKARDIGSSLLFSPAFGFTLAIVFMFIIRRVLKLKSLFQAPTEDSGPPAGVRALLISTCTFVSFMHGSNDGQKGIGLMMVILMAFLPAHYALNENMETDKVLRSLDRIEQVLKYESVNNNLEKEMEKNMLVINELRVDIKKNIDTKDKYLRFEIRKRIQSISKSIDKYLKDPEVIRSNANQDILAAELKSITKITDYAPTWVILMVAICLGLGTMVGWKRIVVTIGEKIGKTHLTYAEGATAELMTALTIGVSTLYKLPVSTTHILSSGVAGAMVASGGIKNLQKKTIVNIALAWVLTLPVCMALAFAFFALFLLIA